MIWLKLHRKYNSPVHQNMPLHLKSVGQHVTVWVYLHLNELLQTYRKACIKKKKEKTKPEKKKRSVKISVCLCGTCLEKVVDGRTKFEEESVGCDKCPLWYHFICAGITEDSRPKQRDSWVCPKCS